MHPCFFKLRNSLRIEGNLIEHNEKFSLIHYFTNKNIYNYPVNVIECANYKTDPDNFFIKNISEKPVYVSFNPKSQALFVKDDTEYVTKKLNQIITKIQRKARIDNIIFKFNHDNTVYGIPDDSFQYQHLINISDSENNFIVIAAREILDSKYTDIAYNYIVSVLNNLLDNETDKVNENIYDNLRINEYNLIDSENNYESFLLLEKMEDTEAFTFHYTITISGMKKQIDIFIPFHNFSDYLIYKKLYQQSNIDRKDIDRMIERYSLSDQKNIKEIQTQIFSIIYGYGNLNKTDIESFINGEEIEFTSYIQKNAILYNNSSSKIAGKGEPGTISDIITLLLCSFPDHSNLNHLEENHKIKEANTILYFDIFPISNYSEHEYSENPYVLSHRKINLHPFIIEIKEYGYFKTEVIVNNNLIYLKIVKSENSD